MRAERDVCPHKKTHMLMLIRARVFGLLWHVCPLQFLEL